MDQNDHDMQGTEGSGSLGGLDVRRRIPIKLLPKQPAVRNKPPARPQRPPGRPPPAPSQPEEDVHVFIKKEERFECGAKAGDVFAGQRRYPQPMFWDYKLNLLGEKDEVPVHCCDKCRLPIKTYGRMIPCKHVFCYDCALLHEKKGDKMCPGVNIYSCTDAVQRIEQCHRGSLYMCSIVQGCKRTYLSQRDLQAHVNHRHLRASKMGGGGGGGGGGRGGGGSESVHHPPPSSDVSDRFRLPPPPLMTKPPHGLMGGPPGMGGHGGHDPYGKGVLGPGPPQSGPHDDHRGGGGVGPPQQNPQPTPLAQETFRIATVTTRKHSNLITVPIQDDSTGPGSVPIPGPGSGPPPQQGPGPNPPGPGMHHPGPVPGPADYTGQPVVSHPHHMMAPPPQPHYGARPPPPNMSLPMQHPPPQASANPHMGVYNHSHNHGHGHGQTGPPPLSTAPPPITPPPGHLIGQMPPYMGHPPPGPPPVTGPPLPHQHHYNPPFPEEQGALSPPFGQQGGPNPGMWPGARGPPPPRMQQGPPPQGQLPPGAHHPDQSRYRPYYQ